MEEEKGPAPFPPGGTIMYQLPDHQDVMDIHRQEVPIIPEAEFLPEIRLPQPNQEEQFLRPAIISRLLIQPTEGSLRAVDSQEMYGLIHLFNEVRPIQDLHITV
jgi:hypothetical protein